MTSAAQEGSDDAVTWQGTRDRQMRSALAASPSERLEALEELMELAYKAGALPRERDETGIPLTPARRLELKGNS